MGEVRAARVEIDPAILADALGLAPDLRVLDVFVERDYTRRNPVRLFVLIEGASLPVVPAGQFAPQADLTVTEDAPRRAALEVRS